MPEKEILNEAQMRAVRHVYGPLLVLAGAGSGKTKVVTHRIAHLIEIGTPPEKILALTFTNKAAEEMRERTHALTEKEVQTSTFHSLGVRILRQSIDLLGYQKDFTIYDEKDREQLLKNCLESLGLKEEKELLKEAKTFISEAKNSLLLPEEISPNSPSSLKRLYSLYQSKLKEYNAVDFDDLLMLTVHLFKTPAGDYYASRWSFVLVDEYQDTNMAQYTICKHLVSKTGNLFVVGDPDQSIYSWRGAHIGNILRFEEDFPGASVITLAQNYRSTNTILKAANALIKSNHRAYDKNLWSELGDGEKIRLHSFYNDRDEAEFVATKIASYAKKIPLDEMVIFYRTNSQSRLFEDALLSLDIPYTIVGGLSFYARKEIKDLLAFLRLLVSPYDFLSFARTVNIPKRGIGPKALLILQEVAKEYNLPILTATKMALLDEIPSKLTKNQKNALSSYISIYTNLDPIKNDLPLKELITKLISLSGYETYLKEDPATLEDRKENISELIHKAKEWEEEHIEPSLSKFLEELTLKETQSEVAEMQKTVKLMTLHNGKGLEFEVCFLVGLEEDLFPHINSKTSLEELEEERRLAYVGITRAKRFLHLSYAKCRFLWGGTKYTTPSRFLSEIPESLILKIV